MRAFFTSLVFSMITLLRLVPTADAGIIVSGDSSLIYTDFINSQNPDNDNFVFLRNLLGNGDRVVISPGALPAPGNSILNNFYGGLPGSTASVVTGTITPQSLESADLLIVALPFNPLTPQELAGVQDYLALGNTLFFIGENSTFAAQNAAINANLAALGSAIRINSEIQDPGTAVATIANGQILSHPLTSNVDTFVYGGFGVSGVSGGAPLFLLRDGATALVAVEPVPEASSLGLAFIGATCLVAWRARRRLPTRLLRRGR